MVAKNFPRSASHANLFVVHYGWLTPMPTISEKDYEGGYQQKQVPDCGRHSQLAGNDAAETATL